ncbi:MAG: hypothetical protein ACK56F_10715, partial [bacterium]
MEPGQGVLDTSEGPQYIRRALHRRSLLLFSKRESLDKKVMLVVAVRKRLAVAALAEEQKRSEARAVAQAKAVEAEFA